MPPLINPLPFVFIIATAFGVVMHDTKVDHATSIAVVNPTYFADSVLSDAVGKSDEHIHVERASVSSQSSSATHQENVPKTQPRNDHNKYTQVKRNANSGGDNNLWPSV
jgi:hypothetical protein